MRAILLALAAMASSCAFADAFNFSSSNPPSIVNTTIEVLPQVYNGDGSVQGPLSSAGPFNTAFTGSISLNEPVASSATLGGGSVTTQGLLTMDASLSGDSISGHGALNSTATLGGGIAGGGSLFSAGQAEFDIPFTLSQSERVTLDLSTSASTSLPLSDNAAVAYLSGPGNSTILLAQSSGSGAQSATWAGVLGPGNYFLSGSDFYTDFVTAQFNGGNAYANSESFAFDLKTASAPEPGTLALWLLGLLGLAAARIRPQRVTARR